MRIQLVILATVLVVALVLTGCSGSGAETAGPGEQPATAGDDSGGSSGVEQDSSQPPDQDSSQAPDVTGPAFLVEPGLSANPNPTVPLAAIVSSETDEPAVIQLTIDDGEIERVVIPDPTPRTDHQTQVLSLHPDRSHTLRVTAIDEAGNSTDGPEELTFTTPLLPATFPPITVTRAAEGLTEPGVTLFNASLRSELQPVPRSYLVMLDGQGEIVWYYDAGISIGDARRLRNGNILFLSGARLMREIDMLGNTVAEWTAIGHKDSLPSGAVAGAVPVETDSFHHEVYELPEGDEADFLVLSSELRIYPDYPASETDPSETEREAQVMGDVIIAFRRDGTIVQEWSLLDILDPYRISYDSLDSDWQLVYSGETRDWSHGNAIVVDPEDGGLIVSLRNQDAVVKIARDSGELLWILGPRERWEEPWSELLLAPLDPPSSEGGPDFELSFHQHAPMFTPTGGLLLFDNGNGRSIPPEAALEPDERYSRFVEYEIDEAARSVTQRWAYGSPDDRWYSGALGDADYLFETGNVLGVDGFIATGDGQRHARIFEVTRTDPAEIVFEVVLWDQESEPLVDWLVYRAERLPSVYP